MYSSFQFIPTKRQRWGAALSCSILLGLAIGTMPCASRQLPIESAFLPVHLTLAIIAALFTGLMLMIQFRATGYVPLAVLSIAYMATATVAATQACAFPGVFAPHGLFGAGPQTSVWLWAIWHGGFPALVILYALCRRTVNMRIEPRPIVAVGVPAIGVALGLCAAFITYRLPLPILLVGNSLRPGFNGIWQVVIALAVSSLIVNIACTRLATTLDMWLIVALVGCLCDILLTIFGSTRFSVGWYLARVYAVVTEFTVATMFLIELSGLYMRFARLASVDPLTGLGNRRTFDERLSEALRAGRRDGTPVAVLMLDVDDFKGYNDAYGHVAGDAALREVAAVARNVANRARDTVARFGGEEFAIVMPVTSLTGATIVAERLCEDIAKRRIPHRASRAAPFLTASIGIAVAGREHVDPTTLIERADAALYRAKEAGRNRVAVEQAQSRAIS